LKVIKSNHHPIRALYKSSRSLRVTTLKEPRPSSGQTLSEIPARVRFWFNECPVRWMHEVLEKLVHLVI